MSNVQSVIPPISVETMGEYVFNTSAGSPNNGAGVSVVHQKIYYHKHLEFWKLICFKKRPVK